MYHPVVNRIISLLNSHSVSFTSFEHQPVTTSQQAADIRPGFTLSQGAKALILKVKDSDGSRFIMVVLPGDKKLSSKKLKTHLSLKELRFASVQEVDQITSGVQIGGVPPFGNLFSLPVYADIDIAHSPLIIFNAGDRSYSISISSSDYLALVKPLQLDICETNATNS